ncbi:MAG: hypothetical protein C4538_07385 [Nitrospiraceae bacterium]|nr:MAG: hypothetical protein C4538_07385 [Nitrospiraceae bacterium]
MAKSLKERRLAEFVDRVSEMGQFCNMLETDEKPIMVVWGESGIGKSTFLARMEHECAQRKLRKAEMVCKETGSTDYMAIMRKIRDDVGVDYFKAFTDLINFFTDPDYHPKIELNINIQGSISILDSGKIEESSTGDIAGIVIKDNMLITPRSDIAIPEAERMARLTDRFIEGLRSSAVSGQVIIFFDAVEKLAPDTEKWLWGEFLDAVRDGKLSGVKFVLCGQKQPGLDRDWRFFVSEAELQPLGLEHIETYLSNRGIEETMRANIAEFLYATTKGKISKIAESVDAFLLLKEKKKGANE